MEFAVCSLRRSSFASNWRGGPRLERDAEFACRLAGALTEPVRSSVLKHGICEEIGRFDTKLLAETLEARDAVEVAYRGPGLDFTTRTIRANSHGHDERCHRLPSQFLGNWYPIFEKWTEIGQPH